MIRKVVIRNYRKFRNISVDLTPGTNILVGGNDNGRSTLIEAINLALTGRVNGRPFSVEWLGFSGSGVTSLDLRRRVALREPN